MNIPVPLAVFNSIPATAAAECFYRAFRFNYRLFCTGTCSGANIQTAGCYNRHCVWDDSRGWVVRQQYRRHLRQPGFCPNYAIYRQTASFGKRDCTQSFEPKYRLLYRSYNLIRSALLQQCNLTALLPFLNVAVIGLAGVGVGVGAGL